MTFESREYIEKFVASNYFVVDGSDLLAMLAFMLSSVLLSGFVFPRQAMPDVVAAIGNILPVTYFITIVRGVMLKEIGIDYLLNISQLIITGRPS